MPVVGIILGLLPGFAWLYFYVQEDINAEPKRLLALTFVNGAAFAFLALAMQLGLKNFFDRTGIGQHSSIWIYAFAGIEELVKFWAAYAAVHSDPDFDAPIDAMLYAIVAALGFATVENIGVIFGTPQTSVFLPSAFTLITFRFLGATLLHTLAAGTIGYYWARSIREFGSKTLLLTGIIFATILHGTFNFLVIHFDEKGFSIIFLVLVAFFVLADLEKLRTKVL